MKHSMRHLRIVLAVAETGSVTRTAARFHVSQPAVSAALNSLETVLATPLFTRQPKAMIPTSAGEVIALRLRRAFDVLDPALAELAPRLTRTTTMAQLTALVAVVEEENFSVAARRLGLAQPTVHRAVRQMESEVGRKLFERSPRGLRPSRAARQVAQAARLAFAELDQAQADLADLAGREVGRVVIGALPLSRSVLLGPAIGLFRLQWKALPIRVIEGPYPELLIALRRGEIDMLVGALRPPVSDLVQEILLNDDMAIVARPGHPMTIGAPEPADLAAFPWVVAAEGTPTRDHFTAMFQAAALPPPLNLVETGSMALLRDLVSRSEHLGFVSARQVARDVASGTLAPVPYRPSGPSRPIGLTTRQGWHPTRAQSDMLAALRRAGMDLDQPAA